MLKRRDSGGAQLVIEEHITGVERIVLEVLKGNNWHLEWQNVSVTDE